MAGSLVRAFDSGAFAAAAFVTLLVGAALRFGWIGHLNFRNDESFTLLDARQSWSAVLGLDGFYDFHPPLSFVLAKIADLVAPEVLSSRLVAALCGTLAIPVFFLLVSIVVNARAALFGSVLLAISPAQVEYSRIGRMYAPVTLAILTSYLAMALFRRAGRRRWALLYGFAVACAVYLDYSALYALIPQLVPLGMIVREMRSRANWLIAGGVGAIIVYAPWLTQIEQTIDLANEYSSRQSYLEASRESVWNAVPWILGLIGGGAGARADWPNFWYRFPNWQNAMLIILLPLAVVGVYALRRATFALAVALCLLVGTPLTCIIVSQISPGFTLRTILSAPLGWSMLAGCALAAVRVPRPMRALALWSGIFLIAASLNALPATFSNKGRVLRVDMASRTVGDVAPMNKPVITFSAGGMDTDLIDAFAGGSVDGLPMYTFYDGSVERRLGMMPWADSGPTRLDVSDGQLSSYFDPTNPDNDAFWFFTHRGARAFYSAFTELGYDRRLQLDFSRVSLEFWALPDAGIGSPLDINGAFAGESPAATGWSVPEGVELRQVDGSSLLVLPESGDTLEVSRSVPGVSAGLYSLDVDLLDDGAGVARVVMECRSTSGELLAEYAEPDETEDIESPDEGQYVVRFSVLCPDGTDSLRIGLGSDGTSQVTYGAVRLVGYPLPSVSHLEDAT